MLYSNSNNKKEKCIVPRNIDYTVTSEYDGRKAVHFLRGHCGFSARLMKKVKFSLVCNGEKLRTDN